MIPGEGASVGRFRIVSVLGRGATGVVFHAHDPTLGRDVALKVLSGGDRATHEQIERFRREAEALARLNHPNVVRVYETGSVEGVRWIALELVVGTTLETVFEDEAVPLDRKLDLLEQVARGVHAAHCAGVVHRDLKPANVLVDREGRARVVDFGLARVEDVSVALTRTGATIGTPYYMAPETVRAAAGKVGPWTDVFSLGAMLFEALTGESPYERTHSFGTLVLALGGPEPAPRPSSVRAGVPEPLEEVCARALAKDPERRFASAADLADALARARATVARARRPRGGWVLGLAAFGLAVLALLSRATPSGPTPSPSPGESQAPPAIEVDWREPADDSAAPDGRTIRVAGRCRRARELLVNGRAVALSSTGEFSAVVPFAGSGEIVLVARAFGLAPVEQRRHLREREGVPSWLRAIPEADRPPLPLPRGVVFGAAPGEYRHELDGTVLVFVPGGPFEMGSQEGEDRERPPHRVVLSPYFLAKLPVTAEQFAAFVAATRHVTDAEIQGAGSCTGPSGIERRPGAHWRDPRADGLPLEARHPVVQVSWNDAAAYAAWAGLALPSEAQWERGAGWEPASRHMRRYSWGDAPAGATGKLVGNVADRRFLDLFEKAAQARISVFEDYDDGWARTSPVGSFPDGASPAGALDMTGNVCQWCQDSYDVDSYLTLPERDPLSERGRETVYRSVRGSHWACGPQQARVTRRNRESPDGHGDYLGFRVALPLTR